MNGYLGIDLGSTTTKAVYVDGAGNVLGRGITDTRANFEAASAVARAEALADARFKLLATMLDGASALAGQARLLHRRSERRARLERLERRSLDLAAGAGDDASNLRAAVEQLFAELSRRTASAPAEALFADALLSEAAGIAEGASLVSSVPYERLAGIFERALVADDADATTLDPAAAIASLATGTAPETVQRAVDRCLAEPLAVDAQAGTGYGRHRLPFAKEEIRSEILCHGLGCKSTFSRTRTVLDIGGQDTKAIQLDERGLVTSFQMNDRCAAGCGRYLGYVADELGLDLSALGPMAMASHRPARINSTCTVFAGTEIRERLALGELREDVVAGLHRAIVVRAMSLLARSGGVANELTFSGGVGRNPAVVKFLRELVAEHYGNVTINVSAESIYAGALGAALFARLERVPC